MASWPLIEPLVITHLRQALSLPAGRVSTDLPGNLQDLPGFIRVSRGPGSDDGITDAPLVDVEAFHPNRLEAAELAERAREAMHSLSGAVARDALVDTVDTATAPSWVFYAANVARYVASYRLSLRRDF